VLAFLKLNGPATASTVGSHLWNGTHKPGDARPQRKPQAFARPAGQLLNGMKADGLVACAFDGYHWMWKSKTTTTSPKRDEWFCGYACALANVLRVTNEPQIANMVLVGDGLTIDDLKTAGVETYDLDELARSTK
jgi:hypothetical protein